MSNVLGVPTLEVGDPVLLLILVKADDSTLHHAGLRSSMYVERGGSVVKPNFS